MSLSYAICFGSSEESKYKYSDENVLSQVAKEADVIFRGRVIKHRVVYYIDGKEASLEEAKKSDTGKSKVFSETVATIKIETVLKGPIDGDEVTLRWSDPYKTDCPHIPMREYFVDGIWFSINQPDNAGVTHHIDWIPASLQGPLEAAIQKWTDISRRK